MNANKQDAGGLPKCPKCGAPCKTEVHARGGDWGWGTSDAERTTYKFNGEQCRAASGDAGVDYELVARMLDDYAIRPCPVMGHEEISRQAQLLRALSRGVPEGMVLVPREPTEAMKIAALKALDPLGELVDWKEEGVSRRDVSDCYAAMVDTAIAAQRKEGV